MQHELAKRTENGIVVGLLWDSLQDRVVVRYRDRRTGESFEADIPRERALDAFHHPNAYRPAFLPIAAEHRRSRRLAWRVVDTTRAPGQSLEKRRHTA